MMGKITTFIKMYYMSIIIIFFILIILLMILFNSKSGIICDISQNNAFYLFSTAAQTIAAFIALIIAGYTFANSAFDKNEKNDETYFETQQIFKNKYYFLLTILGIITVIAIVLNLISIIFVENIYYDTCLLFFITFVFTLASVFGGLMFIFEVLDPDKYLKTAKLLSNKLENSFQEGNQNFVKEQTESKYRDRKITKMNFIDDFIKFEKEMRQFIKKKQMIRNIQYMGIKQMANDLLKLEVIDRIMYNRILLVSDIRNMVVHGQIETVDEEVARDLRRLRTEFKKKSKKKYPIYK